MNKCCYIGLFVVSFSYLTMCPAAEKISKGSSDTPVVHTCISTMERAQSKSELLPSPAFFSREADAGVLSPERILLHPALCFSFHVTGPSTLLSTVRLLL